MDIRSEIDNALEDLEENVALKVKRDVYQRIADWVASGGSLDDAYIKRQVEYCQKVGEVMRG